MSQISTKLDLGYAEFTFEDSDGHIFSRFKVNPADLGIVKRSAEVGDFFNTIADGSTDDVLEKEHEIGEKLNYLLGYKSYDDVFGEVGPLTILPDGRFFIECVMDKFAEAITPIIAERQAKMAKNMGKYTKKYTKKKPTS